MYKVHHIHNNTEICRPDFKHEQDLFVTEIGHSMPPPGYASNKNKRSTYVFHYVISGKGVFNKNEFEGPCLITGMPEEVMYYTVDHDAQSPNFEQYWILFGGDHAAKLLANVGFSLTFGVYPCPYISKACQTLRELQNTHHYVEKDDNLVMISGLYQLMALHYAYVFGHKRQYSDRVQKLLDYIHENYTTLITEDSLAQTLHLSTRYMHRIFKTELGISPIQYLNSYRINCAKKMLIEDNLSINAIASATGFATHNYFCTVFRKYNNGMSPLEYRKLNQAF